MVGRRRSDRRGHLLQLSCPAADSPPISRGIPGDTYFRVLLLSALRASAGGSPPGRSPAPNGARFFSSCAYLSGHADQRCIWPLPARACPPAVIAAYSLTIENAKAGEYGLTDRADLVGDRNGAGRPDTSFSSTAISPGRCILAMATIPANMTSCASCKYSPHTVPEARLLPRRRCRSSGAGSRRADPARRDCVPGADSVSPPW